MSIIFTGKGNGGKSLFFHTHPVWIKWTGSSHILWSNEDDINEEPKGTGFVKYENYKQWYEEVFLGREKMRM